MRRRQIYYGFVLAMTFVLALVVATLLQTDRIYTHFFYIPITLTAAWYPSMTILLGLGASFVHLLIELGLRGGVGAITLVRALIIIVVSVILQQIWRKERHYQRLVDQLSEKSYRDGLTGVYNRQYLEDMLEQPLVYPVSIFVCDIDGLKTINDSHGHLVGDRYICLAARLLLSSVRQSDAVMRSGGDEFVILAQNCTAKQAEHIKQRILYELESLRAEPSEYPVSLSLSVGCAQALSERQLHETLRTADQNMYAGKQTRKRQLV